MDALVKVDEDWSSFFISYKFMLIKIQIDY